MGFVARACRVHRIFAYMTVKHMRVCVPACVSARARGTGVFGLRSVTRSSTLIFSTRLLIPRKFPDEYSARRFDARSHSLWCMHVCEFECRTRAFVTDMRTSWLFRIFVASTKVYTYVLDTRALVRGQKNNP
jgi:hypothetical protein